MTDFGRVITAIVTPFAEDQSLNVEAAQKLADHLVNNGSDGLVVSGSTGESPVLTTEEKVTLFKAVKEAVGSRAKVLAGTGSNNTMASIELTAAAEACGVDGVMLVVPYYNKPSQEGLYRHFTQIARSTSLPVMLYNIPSRTGANLLPATVARLAGEENIVALKEASGSLDQVSEIAGWVGDKLTIYSGDDSLTLPMLALGAAGVVSVAAHIVGPQMQEMVQAFLSGQVERARQLHHRLFPVFKGLFITTNPVPVKAALRLLGQQVGPPRLPLVDVTPAEEETLQQMLVKAGLSERWEVSRVSRR